MHLALTMLKSAYDVGGSVPILGVEVVDPTVYAANAQPILFQNLVDGTQYVKKVVEVTDTSVKVTIINNYSDCHYDAATNTIVPDYTNPTNRAISNYDERYPMAMDNPINQ